MIVSVSVGTLAVAFLYRFSPKSGTEVTTPKVRMSSLSVNIATSLPLFFSRNCYLRPKGSENPCKHKYANFCLGNSRKSRVTQEIRVKEHDSDVRFQIGSRNRTVVRVRIEKSAHYNLSGRIAEISATYRKSESRKTMVNINDRKAEQQSCLL